ncbi:uncharacterized protein LOC121920980 isoform X2 [Sceloporus undulatus]|uniref:uncharacterized protein LOC121920980 isoform X2 n=1 Tax=Sceloporus undulatus TaxID=8520 RepID=UPI001C4D3100|nr:uncharacterized protein LOC121920980 isoform X2 [Sceloporus undulatus]
MDSVLQESLATLLSRRSVCIFCVIWLATQLAFLNACEYQPASNERCTNYTKDVPEGGSLEVPLGTLKHISDFCIWNISSSRWDSACQFVSGNCQPLLTNFNKSISVLGKTFVMQNVGSGRYRILDLSRNCLEINVFMSDRCRQNTCCMSNTTENDIDLTTQGSAAVS